MRKVHITQPVSQIAEKNTRFALNVHLITLHNLRIYKIGFYYQNNVSEGGTNP